MPETIFGVYGAVGSTNWARDPRGVGGPLGWSKSNGRGRESDGRTLIVGLGRWLGHL